MMNEKQPPPRDEYSDLARRLGFDGAAAKVEGPSRGLYAGPTDETPLEKLHRLSALLELVAAEIQTMRSATYRAQLWQQWVTIWRRRPEQQRAQKRLRSSSGGSAT
jgi:hypothetical protein